MTNHDATMTSMTSKGGRRALTLGIAASAAIAMFLGGMAGTASAGTDGDSTIMSVNVASSIAFTIDPNFALTDGVNAITTGSPVAGSVDWTVTTNSETGYSVTFAPVGVNMVGTSGNTDVIALSTVTWDDAQNGLAGDTPPAAITASNAIWTQDTRSSVGGDNHTNDFALTVPFVNSDTYSATLDYLASTAE